MKKIFSVAGVAAIVLGVIAFLVLLVQPIAAFCTGISLVLSGALMLSVSDLLGRVAYLEEQLQIFAPGQTDSQLPQRRCAVCDRDYDFDYPKCPHCGHAPNDEKNT